MSTPLYNAILAQLETGRARYFMPGHKGILPAPLSEVAPFDVTEVPLTGSLFEETEPFLSVERTIEEYYKSGKSLLSAGGSTLCIQAMLSTFCPPKSSILAARNSHVALVNCSALLDLRPIWLYPDTEGGIEMAGTLSPEAVSAALKENPEVSAVYLTSPDYFGCMPNIPAIAAICHEHHVPLLIDNAHGAHLAFFDLHPMQLGADACCDSFHKTLPCLTGAAVLHLADKTRAARARRMMSVFGSTSPSYPILLSIDLAVGNLPMLCKEYQSLSEKVAKLRAVAMEKGVFATVGRVDPVRISLLFKKGKRQATIDLLTQCGIEPEYVSDRHVVLLPSIQSDLRCVYDLIERLAPLCEAPSVAKIQAPIQALTPREAYFAITEDTPVEKCVGRIAAETKSICPPGLPLIMPGEVISEAVCEKLSGTISTVVV